MGQTQPPKLDPARRNVRVGPLKLPAEGRQGETPGWPLSGRQTAPERVAWEQLWATPHAVVWERLGWTRTVARYCRAMVAAERPNAQPGLLAQVTAMEDRLGLTPKAMRMLLWEVVEDELAIRGRSDSLPERVRREIKAV